MLSQEVISLVPNEGFSKQCDSVGEEGAEHVIKCVRLCTASKCLL